MRFFSQVVRLKVVRRPGRSRWCKWAEKVEAWHEREDDQCYFSLSSSESPFPPQKHLISVVRTLRCQRLNCRLCEGCRDIMTCILKEQLLLSLISFWLKTKRHIALLTGAVTPPWPRLHFYAEIILIGEKGVPVQERFRITTDLGLTLLPPALKVMKMRQEVGVDPGPTPVNNFIHDINEIHMEYILKLSGWFDCSAEMWRV